MSSVLTKLRGLAGDFRFHVEKRGWSSAAAWLGRALPALVCWRIEYLVLARSLEGPLPEREARVPVKFSVAGPETIDRLRSFVPPSEADYFARRLALGRTCMVAWIGDEVAAYAWATDQVRFEIDNLEIRLEPGDAYVDDNFTWPRHRGLGVQTALHLHLLKWLQARSFRRVLAIVEMNNASSLKVVDKLGYRPVDRLHFRRFLHWRRYRYLSDFRE